MPEAKEIHMSVEEYKAKISELEHQLQTAHRRLDEMKLRVLQAEGAAERSTIESHLRAAALHAGIVDGAVDDVVARAVRAGEWKVDTKGKLIRMRDGVADVDTHGQPITPKSYFRALKAEAPFYFAEAATATKGGDGADNPWSAEAWNVTKQSRLCSINMDEARRLAAAAGSSLDATKPAAAKVPAAVQHSAPTSTAVK
jgi:hypothetical protein